MARVVIENLSKLFTGPAGAEVPAVRNVNLTIEEKELLVLLGPSGSGKTTTLRLIAGLEDVTQGTVSIDSQVVNDVPPKDRDIAMVFQNYALYPHMTVFENMAFGLKLRKVPRMEIERRVRDTAEMLGLTAYLNRKPSALSGGERQRVAVGRAVVRRPKVFLFDEPLSNLDPQMRVQMRTEISKLHARLGVTMIYVTHDQVEAMTIGDRIAVMKDGVMQQVADPLTLYEAPVNHFVAGFIGSPPMNFFEGVAYVVQPSGCSAPDTLKHGHQANGHELVFGVENQPKESSLGAFAVHVDQVQAVLLSNYIGKRLILGLRPEHIQWAPQVAGLASSAAVQSSPPTGNIVTARIEMVESLGSETCVHLNTGRHVFIARIPPREPIKADRNVSVFFQMAEAHFFDPDTGLAIV
jgi:multiple sugar transport system ATP-binding protein